MFIKNLSFTTVAGPKNTLFSFIARDERLGRTTCFIFQAGTQAYDICVAVGKAFQAAAEEMKAQVGNPFLAQPGEVREGL